MKKQVLFIMALLLVSSVFAQKKDAEAKKILDAVSTKTKSYQTINAKFLYTIEAQKKEEAKSYEGNVFIKGNKYKLFLLKNEIFFDGTSLTTFSTENNEATISSPSKNDENSVNPANIFTIYEKGFKYQLVGDETIDGVKLKLIELVPEKRDNKKYSKVKIWINKEKSEICQMKVLSKNGNNFTVKILSFKPNVKVTDDLFIFKAAEHPKVEINDMRE